LGVLSALLDGAALTASRQAQAKSRIRIGASLEQKKSPTAAGAQDKKSVAQESIRVLVAAPSNAAVDELIVRLLSEGVYDARQCKSYRPRIVRVGRPESLQQQLPSSGSGQQQRDLSRKKKWRKYASEVEEILLETLVNKNKSAFPTAKQARQTIIQNAQIVFCTLSGAGSVAMCELQTQHFDALVIDEAAQAVESSLLIPFKFQPSRVVLVGDHRQLPATVISKRLIELGYDRSLFQRLVENGSRVFMLTQQYRMHPEISWFPSTYFYNSKLIEAPQMKEWTARKYHREPLFRPFLFFDVLSGKQSQVAGSKSLRNVNEIECILQLLTRLVVDQFPELEWKRRIGIIAPYKQQIYELRNELQKWERQHDKRLDIEVNTVDGFQGREKEVIIYSCVRTGRAGQGRSSSRQNAQTIEAFWADERRMNVAITRAKSSLWIIGNSTLLKQSAAWRALITHAKDSRRYILDDELMGSQQQRSTGSANSQNKSRDKTRARDGGDRHSRDRSQSRDRRR
jgi:senataxin